MRHRFQDQVVIVTGASRGIGKSIAELFAKEGAKLVLVARDENVLSQVAESLAKNGTEAIAIRADVSHSEDVARIIQETLVRYGRIDILCHNAGIYPHARLENMTIEQWQKVIDVNLTSTFLTIKACIPAMKAQGGGKIVVTSSISGPQTGPSWIFALHCVERRS
jgi:3-oxoacyl-[acyl-carrier protein] reductase